MVGEFEVGVFDEVVVDDDEVMWIVEFFIGGVEIIEDGVGFVGCDYGIVWVVDMLFVGVVFVWSGSGLGKCLCDGYGGFGFFGGVGE